jgi:putative ABC transport system ATP-binding protein
MSILASFEKRHDLILKATRLFKTYGSGTAQTEALRGVDIQVYRSEFLAIIGPSGSGKSTLLHLIGAIEPPTSGEILFDDKLLSAMSDDERSIVRRRCFGFIFQRINLLPTLSSIENVALPLLIDNEPRATALEKAQKALEMAGIAHRGRHLPSEMSGGEQQRVAIARALVIEPALILADEPTGALDRVTGRKIVAELRACVEDGRAVVVVTHDPEIADQADRKIVVCDGLIQQIVRNPKARADAADIPNPNSGRPANGRRENKAVSPTTGPRPFPESE